MEAGIEQLKAVERVKDGDRKRFLFSRVHRDKRFGENVYPIGSDRVLSVHKSRVFINKALGEIIDFSLSEQSAY